MKSILLLSMLFFLVHSSNAQTYPLDRDFQIKLQIGELVFDFPRIGLGAEQKLEDFSVWTSFHIGWDAINIKTAPYYIDGDFKLWGWKGGGKKINYMIDGENYWGFRIEYDKTNAAITESVFYNIEENTAVLFDRANYNRSRLGFLLEKGYEYEFGIFSIDFSMGAGIRRIERWYNNVQNPFVLNEVLPKNDNFFRQHEYADTVWKSTFMLSLKLGLRVF